MNKYKVILGSHNHLSYGSAKDEFERVYKDRLKPFITVLYRFPKIPAVLHYSGVLLKWIEKHHPEFLMILEDMLNRKQIEILGGGFYEPMFPLISLTDKLGQIELLTTFIRKQFGKRPRGCWLPGMMWEQNMTGPLQTCGMDYVFLDESQFISAGFGGVQLRRPCVTEDQGKIIAVFPVASKTSALLEHKSASELLQKQARDPDNDEDTVISLFPEYFLEESDGESAFEDSFYRFLEGLAQTEEYVEFTLPSKYLKSSRKYEKAFFPSSADKKIMYWSLDEKRRKGFDELERLERRGDLDAASSYYSGAFPRQFLVRYPEANGIYSKMMYTHTLINQLRGDKHRKRAAREELWKAQGCEAFWHVAEGGLYNNNLRKAAYRALLDAEKITRERGVFLPSVVSFDIDLDGMREYLFQGTDLNCYVKTQGAAIFELDYLSKSWNYLDTFARRRESYASDAVLLDGYRRCAFMDRLVTPETSLKDAENNQFVDSRFCALEQYEPVSVTRSHHEVHFKLPASATGPYAAIEILKKYRLYKNSISVSYTLTNTGNRPERFNFIPQIDLSLSGDDEKRQRIAAVRSGVKQRYPLDPMEIRDLDELVIDDLKNEIPLSLTSSGSFDAWIIPIYSYGRVNADLAYQYQSTCIMPQKAVILAPQESWNIQFSLSLGGQ